MAVSHSYSRRALAALTAVTTALTLALPPPAAAAPTTSTPAPTWTPCVVLEDFPEVECAVVRVPLDHDRPSGETIGIALARRPADDQARRIGSIFVNPGGPGGPGRFLAAVAEYFFAPEVLERFDIVGFDPRGIGASDPLQCFATDAEAEALLNQMTDVPVTATEIRDTLRANYAYTEGCKRGAGPLLNHMSTLNVAKDLDRLRAAVGDDRLNYVGYSYGTLIGATYANLFPGRVRAMVIDGNVDPHQRTNDRLVNKFERAGGFEIALSGFLRECDAAGPACAFSGGARAKFDRLRDRFREGPVTLPDGTVLVLDDLIGFIGGVMYSVASFPDAASTLQEVYTLVFEPPAGARLGRSPSLEPPAGRNWKTDAYSFNGVDSFLAVNCADAPLPRVPALYPGFAVAFEAAHPTFGRAEAFSEVACANWPRVEERYAGPWDRRTARTVLVVNPTFDPATRYSFAQRMTRQLGNARLLTLDGFGHSSSFSACVTGWYTRYLLAGDLPPVGTRCAQDLPPFPAG
ncbi:MAG TPA: alpha/beta hydrolase [Micromonosporaceae bacterium]|nr:alpha/beta hydrolase [Micromonosporaceae bacterium]